MNWFSAVIEWSIQRTVCTLGRRVRLADTSWLAGPVGQLTIGPSLYQQLAAEANLALHQHRAGAGLIGDFDQLGGGDFRPADVDPAIHRFYEATGDYTLDTWAQWHGPLQPLARVLIRSVSRDIDQLNLPLSALDIGRGMSSEILHLVEPGTSRLVYAGWLRQAVVDGRVVMAGLYSLCRPPVADQPCVRAIMPLPSGSATVILRPTNQPDGSFLLSSTGHGFGDAGYYRLHRIGDGLVRAFYAPLQERIHIYRRGSELRADQLLSWFGRPLLTLHYKIVQRAPVIA